MTSVQLQALQELWTLWTMSQYELCNFLKYLVSLFCRLNSSPQLLQRAGSLSIQGAPSTRWAIRFPCELRSLTYSEILSSGVCFDNTWEAGYCKKLVDTDSKGQRRDGVNILLSLMRLIALSTCILNRAMSWENSTLSCDICECLLRKGGLQTSTLSTLSSLSYLKDMITRVWINLIFNRFTP